MKRLQNDNSTWPERTGYRFLHLAPRNIGQHDQVPTILAERKVFVPLDFCGELDSQFDGVGARKFDGSLGWIEACNIPTLLR